MPRDRIVYWNGKDRLEPTGEEIQQRIEHFLGQALASIQWWRESGRFYVRLVGNYSAASVKFNMREGTPRELEVISTRSITRATKYKKPVNCLDVITRDQDPYTNAVAYGLARSFADTWKGELERE